MERRRGSKQQRGYSFCTSWTTQQPERNGAPSEPLRELGRRANCVVHSIDWGNALIALANCELPVTSTCYPSARSSSMRNKKDEMTTHPMDPVNWPVFVVFFSFFYLFFFYFCSGSWGFGFGRDRRNNKRQLTGVEMGVIQRDVP